MMQPIKGTTFYYKYGTHFFKRVVICCDHIRTRKDLEDTVVHELTHAFDSLRKGTFKSVCHLIACGEIRASAIGNSYDKNNMHI